MTNSTRPVRRILAVFACLALMGLTAFSRAGIVGERGGEAGRAKARGRASGGATAASASPVTGMAVWLKADKGPACGVPCANGDRVGSWSDQSGNENNATTVSGAPIFHTGEVNGLPAITNGGGMMLASAVKWSGQITVFAEYLEISAATNDILSGTGAAPFTFRTNARHQDAIVPPAGDLLAGTATFKPGQFVQGNVVYNGTTGAVALRFGGAADGSGMSMQKVGSGNNLIFQLREPADTLELAELIVYASALSEANISANEAYLHGKYGN